MYALAPKADISERRTLDWRGLTARICLDPYVWKRTLPHHLQRLCAQASVAERQLSSRLSGGEAVYVSCAQIKTHQAKQKRQNIGRAAV